MSLNRPPSARGRGRGRWSSPGSDLDNKLQNRLGDGQGREDGYEDDPRIQVRHNDHLRTEDRYRDGPRIDDRHDQKSPRGVDISPNSRVPSSQRGRGQKTRVRNKRPDAQIYVPRGRRQQQVPVNQHDDTTARQPHNIEVDSRTGNIGQGHGKGDMDPRYSDVDSRTRNIGQGHGKGDMDPRNCDVDSRTRNIGQGHGKGNIDLHNSDVDCRTGDTGQGHGKGNIDLRNSDVDCRTGDIGQGHGKGNIDLRNSDVDCRTGDIGQGHKKGNIDLRNSDMDSRSENIRHWTGDMNICDRDTDNKKDDMDSRTSDMDLCHRPMTERMGVMDGGTTNRDLHSRADHPPSTNRPANKQVSQQRKSRPQNQVYVPPHHRHQFRDTSGPSHQVTSGPLGQENSSSSNQETSGSSDQVTSGLSYQAICDPRTNSGAQDMETVSEFRDEKLNKSKISDDPLRRTKVKRVKLNNSVSKLKSGDEIEREQKSAFVLSDSHNEQCSLTSDPSSSLPEIHDLAPSESNIHNHGPSESNLHDLAQSKSDIHTTALSESDIHNPGSSESDIHNPGPSESDVHVPCPSESQIHMHGPSELDANDYTLSESDIHMTGPSGPHVHDLVPSESDIQNSVESDIPSCVEHTSFSSEHGDQRCSHGDMVDVDDCSSRDKGKVQLSATNPDTSTDIKNIDTTFEQETYSKSNESWKTSDERDSVTLEERSTSSKESCTTTSCTKSDQTTATQEDDNDSDEKQTVEETNVTENFTTIKKDNRCEKEQIQESSNQVDGPTISDQRCVDKENSVMASSTICCPDNKTDGAECMDVDVDNELCSGDEEKDEEEDSWDKMFDDEGECVDPDAMEELTSAIGKVKIKKPVIDYLAFKPREPDLSRADMGHVIEIYDFPAELKTEDLMSAFQQFKNKGFDIKWVDDTHALGVFNSVIAAQSALSLSHPLLKVRAMSEAARQSKEKAKRCVEFLLPYKARPETSVMTARRLVTGALGLAPKVSREQRDLERQKLRQAKEKKKLMKKQKDDIWEGTYTSGNAETS